MRGGDRVWDGSTLRGRHGTEFDTGKSRVEGSDRVDRSGESRTYRDEFAVLEPKPTGTKTVVTVRE